MGQILDKGADIGYVIKDDLNLLQIIINEKQLDVLQEIVEWGKSRPKKKAKLTDIIYTPDSACNKKNITEIAKAPFVKACLSGWVEGYTYLIQCGYLQDKIKATVLKKVVN